tara:strand:+ start:258 stop:488 length:231 start_codon:yes stop_codon:yes gene_type:complete
LNGSVFAFVFTMWILILLGGGLLVLFIGPTSFEVIYDIEPLLNSGLKVLIALILIFIWVFVLTKIKNWIFKRQIKP